MVGYTHDLAPDSYNIVASVADVEAIDWTRHRHGVRIFYQTTLNADDYEDVARAVELAAPKVERAATICYATKENQDAARELASAPEVDVIVVVGGRRSANTRHLWELCERYKPSYLVHEAVTSTSCGFAGRGWSA